jgi:hypothetical protein
MPLEQLMQNEFPDPYQPSAPEVAAKSKRIAASSPVVDMVSLLTCIVSGILFVGAMHVANYEGETVVLMMAGLALLLLSIIVGFLKLRTIVPMFTLFPSCFVVAIRHVGDMGQMHYIDGGLYLFTLLIFFCSLLVTTAAKFGLAIHRRRS